VNRMPESPDELLRTVAAGGSGYATNELLNAFLRGYPIEKLRELLRSSDREALKRGIWLAAELTEHALPLLDDIRVLLEHPDRYVRYYAIEVMLWTNRPEHGAPLAEAITHVEDPDAVVRSEALQLLARASDDQLEWALPHLAPNLADLTRQFLTTRGLPDDNKDVSSERDSLAHAFSLVASARRGDQARLREALTASDEALRFFAEDELRFRS
jgi:hypothetical protein